MSNSISKRQLLQLVIDRNKIQIPTDPAFPSEVQAILLAAFDLVKDDLSETDLKRSVTISYNFCEKVKRTCHSKKVKLQDVLELKGIEFLTLEISKSDIVKPLVQPKSKGGRPSLDYESKGQNAQYKEASEILEKYCPEAIFRAATLAAFRSKMSNATYIYRSMEVDTESAATKLRDAEKYYNSHPRKIAQCLIII